MRESFDRALTLVLEHEGGYSNHPKDPGGATMKGVTQRTYDAWRDDHHQPRQSVRSISGDEIGAIYRSRYWNMVRGDDLPAGVDYAVFDLAVNSGPDRAVRMLQNIVGTEVDGKMGPKTLAKVRAKLATAIIADLCRERLEFLRRLTTWSTFGRGWQRRVDGVLTEAQRMVDFRAPADAAEPVPPPPPKKPVPAPVQRPSAPAVPIGTVAGGGLLAAILGSSGAPIGWVVGALVVGILIAVLAAVWRRRR